MKTSFNFRHVMCRLGINPSKEKNWAVGNLLSRWAKENGIEPSRPLAAKSDPNPKVAAPHCICHYPSRKMDSAIEYVRSRLDGSDPDQLQLL